MILPTFLLIGTPQSATTWLYKNLLIHPEIDIPIKETCFFSKEWGHKTIEWYSGLYDVNKPIRGDMTPHYIKLNRNRIANAYDLMPTAKLLCMIRDPVDRAWSQIRRTVGPNATANQAKTVLEDELKNAEKMGFDLQMDNSKTKRGITNWLQFYPEESLLRVPFENVSSQPRQLIKQVLLHIKADPDAFSWNKLKTRRINSNPSARMPPEIKHMLEKRYEQRF